jgi:hypothetical protein
MYSVEKSFVFGKKQLSDLTNQRKSLLVFYVIFKDFSLRIIPDH